MPLRSRSVRNEPRDVVAREALLDACFGDNRHTRTCQRLRDGRAPAEGLALSAVRQGRLVGTVRLWHVSAGGRPALMLGPLAVDDTCRGLGVGAALMDHALDIAKAARPRRGDPARRRAVLRPLRLLGRTRPASCRCPARSSATACSASSCATGALDGAWGMIAPTGALLPKPQAAAPGRHRSPCRTRPERAGHAGEPPSHR